MKILNKLSINTSLPLAYVLIVGIIISNTCFYQIPHRVKELTTTHIYQLKQMSNFLQASIQHDVSQNTLEHSKDRLTLYKINNFNIDFISLYDQQNKLIHVTNDDSFVNYEEEFFKESFFELRDIAKEKNQPLIIDESIYSHGTAHQYDIRAIVPIRFEFTTPLPLAEHIGTLIIHYNFVNEVVSSKNVIWKSTLIFILIFTFFYVLHAFFIYRSMFKSLHALREYAQDYRGDINKKILNFKAEGFKEIVEISDIYIALLKDVEHELIDKNRLNETLQENQKILALTQTMSKIGRCEWQNEENLWLSDEVYNIFEVGKDFSASLGNLLYFVHLEDRQKVIEWFKSHEDRTEVSPLQYRIITPKNEEKVILNTSRFISHVGSTSFKIITSIQDVTSQVQKDITLKRYKMAIEQSPMMIIITDKRANIEYANHAFGDITGYKIEDVIGKNTKILNSKKQSREFYKEMWHTLKNKQVWSGELINKKSDGTFFNTKLIISPLLDDKDEIVSYVSVEEDITQERQKEELFRMNNRQAQMGEMIAMIAHQWRQPLGAIGAIANKMKMNALLGKTHEDDINKDMDNISMKIQFLSSTIDDFRTFFKPNKEKAITSLETVSDKALDVMSGFLNAEQVKIIRTYNSVPRSLLSYESELLQVVLNLLKNSYDIFLEKSIENAFIEITTLVDDAHIILHVTDNAGGIPEEIINDIFLPYFSTKEEKNGTGLGLYMCKSIIEDHCEGELLVQNYEDGARFSIILPFDKDADEVLMSSTSPLDSDADEFPIDFII